MRHFDSQSIGVDQGSAVLFQDFQHDGVMWTGEGARSIRYEVRFSKAFRTPPVVKVSISMWDMDHSTNARADISAENVTETGFEIVFQTWGDTRIARVRADWLAIGDLPHPDNWDVD